MKTLTLKTTHHRRSVPLATLSMLLCHHNSPDEASVLPNNIEWGEGGRKAFLHFCHESPSSSVVRAPDQCTGGHGFNSRRGLRFFLCPKLVAYWIFHLSHFFPSLKIYHLSFFIITHGAFDIADPSSMQDPCHNELSKYDLARHESPSSSVVRAPNQRTGGHGFNSCRGLRFFLCPMLVTYLNIPSFSILSMFPYRKIEKYTHWLPLSQLVSSKIVEIQ